LLEETRELRTLAQARLLAGISTSTRREGWYYLDDEWLESRNACADNSQVHFNGRPVDWRSAVKHGVLLVASKYEQ
jgi:hypothetical protein